MCRSSLRSEPRRKTELSFPGEALESRAFVQVFSESSQMRNLFRGFRVSEAVVRSVLQGWVRIVALLAVAVLGTVAVSSVALSQEPDNPPQDDFWLNKDRYQSATAAQVVGLGGNPLAALILRSAGLQYVVWGEIGFAQASVPELRPSFLRDIKDNRWLPNLEKLQLDNIPPADLAFCGAYSEALVNAFDVPMDVFKKSAEENRTVTIAHLMSTPARYRGKVIGVQGRMVRLRREEPTHAAKEKGVKSTYVGWVFGPTKHSNPFCVQFPILPQGLEPSEKMDQEVQFYGYFLATYKYEGARNDDNTPRILTTPLLIGPTVLVEKKAPVIEKAETPLALVILGLAVSFLLFLSVVFFLMFFWFQRGDRKVLSSLDEIKSKNLPPMFTNESETGTPANPATAHLIVNGQPPGKLPEARPIDPERN